MTSDAARRADRLSTPAPLPLPQFVEVVGDKPAVARRPRAAVIAVHGMGQQSRYDTMTSLAGRLDDMTNAPNTARAIKVVNRQMDERPQSDLLRVHRSHDRTAARRTSPCSRPIGRR